MFKDGELVYEHDIEEESWLGVRFACNNSSFLPGMALN